MHYSNRFALIALEFNLHKSVKKTWCQLEIEAVIIYIE